MCFIMDILSEEMGFGLLLMKQSLNGEKKKKKKKPFYFINRGKQSLNSVSTAFELMNRNVSLSLL